MENPTQEVPAQETNASKKSKQPYFIAAGLILLLAAAAFAATRYFAQENKAAMSSFGSGQGPVFSDSDGVQRAFQLNVKPAEELPKTQPETMGIYVERKDNSIFIGTGDAMMTVAKSGGADSETQVDVGYSGDKVEIVVSNATIVYRETTRLDPKNPEEEIQQTVELSTIEDIAPQSSIAVWGRKAGDRVIADVLLFSSPYIFSMEGNP